MQRPPHLTPPDLLVSATGFTLIELLVAMVAGMAVIGALFGILEVPFHQTANLTDRVQSNQNGRIAMTRIIDALHSTCLSPEFKPIQESSSENDLSFVNAYSNEKPTSPTPPCPSMKSSGTKLQVRSQKKEIPCYQRDLARI